MKTRKKLNYNLSQVMDASNLENGTGIGSIKSSNLNDDDRPYTSDELPIASGHESFAFGKKCQSTGKRSFTFGNGNKAKGNCTFVIGQLNDGSGNADFIFGNGNTSALGGSSFPAGSNQSIIGGFGNYNRAENNINIGRGNSCVDGRAVNALGQFINNSTPSSLKIGQYNIDRATAIFEIGNGSDSNNRSNAFEVYKDGTIADGKGKIDIHNLVDGEGLYSIAQKRLTSTGEESICQTYQQAGTALGGDTQVGMTENQFMEAFPSGTDPWGSTYENSYNFSFVCGDQVVVKSRSSFGTGRQNTINGKAYYSAVFGDNNLVNGPYSMASGANGGILEGVRGGHIFGNGLRAVSDWETAVGKWNAAHSGILFDVGNGIDNTHRSSAFEVYLDGRAKVYGSPLENNDLVRKQELDATESKRPLLYRHVIESYQGKVIIISKDSTPYTSYPVSDYNQIISVTGSVYYDNNRHFVQGIVPSLYDETFTYIVDGTSVSLKVVVQTILSDTVTLI